MDDVKTTSEVNTALTFAQSKQTAFAIPGQTSDNVTFLEFIDTDFDVLKEAIEECRVVKDEYEIALTLKANEISAIAHTALLKAVKHAKNERELEALFLQNCIANGCREQAYHSIVASGTAAATLHYGKNDQPLEGKLNLLLDAGGEYNCYASDIVGYRCSAMLLCQGMLTDSVSRLEHFRLVAYSAKKVGIFMTLSCKCSMRASICSRKALSGMTCIYRHTKLPSRDFWRWVS